MRKQNLFKLTAEVRKITKDLPVIVGSQAIFAITDFPPEIVRKSIECDYLLLKDFAEKRPNLTEQLGVFSDYQKETGTYADILGLATVVLPYGWEKRLVKLQDENDETIAFCAEIHDVAVSKLMAGREKDFEFLQTAFQSDYLEIETFIERIKLILDSPSAEALNSRMKKMIGRFEQKRILHDISKKLREFKRRL